LQAAIIQITEITSAKRNHCDIAFPILTPETVERRRERQVTL